MMKFVFLCSPDKVKENTIVNYNVEDGMVANAIRNAQKRIEFILGTHLLNRLMELAYNRLHQLSDTIDDESNVEYKTLLDDFVSPALIQMSVSELLLMVSYKVRNIGVAKTDDANIQTATYEEVMGLRADNDVFVGIELTKLSKYLDSQKNIIAELKENTASWQKKPMLGRHFTNCNLWLG